MLSRVTQRIRPVDAVVAGILCALAAFLASFDGRVLITADSTRSTPTPGSRYPSSWPPPCQCCGGGEVSWECCWRRAVSCLCMSSPLVT